MYKKIVLVTLLVMSIFVIKAQKTDSLFRLLNSKSTESKFDIWTQIGTKYKNAGNFDSASFAYKSSYKYFKTQSQLVRYFQNQGNLYRDFGRYNNALQYFDSAISVCVKIKDTAGELQNMHHKSLVLRDMFKLSESVRLCELLVKKYMEVNDSAGVADMFSQIGGAYIRQNKYDSAKYWIEKALALRTQMNDTSKMAASFANIAKIAQETNDYSKAIKYYTKSLGFYKHLHLYNKIAYSHLLLGGTYWASKKYQKALDNYLICLKMYQKTSQKQQVASSLKNIGLIYRDIGNIKKAIEYHKRSLREYEKIGNNPRIALALNILAGDYWSKGDFNYALKVHKRALKIRLNLKNYVDIASSLNNIALVFKSLEKYDSAYEYYNKALVEYSKIKDKKNQASVLNNIGNLFYKQNKYSKAILYFDKALTIRREINHVSGIGYSSLNKGQVYFDQNKYSKAYSSLLIARKIAKKQNDYYLLKTCTLLLSKIAKKNGHYKNGLKYFEEYNKAEQKLRLDESIRRIADMQIRFETEKRQRIVQQKKAEIARKDIELHQQKVRIYYLIGALILFAILIVVTIIAFIDKRKSNVLLSKQNKEIEAQKNEIASQRDIATQQRDKIAEQNLKITDSIRYALRIQKALLPLEEQMQVQLKKHFILFKPRDVVSGDFYYFQPYQNSTIIAAADCTGHGVPGAFMSMLGISLINEIVAANQINNAAELLNELRKRLKINLHQTSVTESNSDGIDIALIMLDRQNMQLSFAGANNPLVIVRDNEIIEVSADRMPIGIHVADEIPFKDNLVNLKQNDKLYLYSDGFVDQFGGPRGRKLMSKNFKRLLLETSNCPIEQQKSKLESFFIKWKGENRQVDDVLVMGLEM